MPIQCGWEWFPEKKGLVTGLIVGGFGFGAFLFGFLSTALVNPADAKIPDGQTFYANDISERVPGMLRWCTLFWAILCLISICTVRRSPDFMRKQKIRERAQWIALTQEQIKNDESVG